MYLLNRLFIISVIALSLIFTFHYVSIKSSCYMRLKPHQSGFTFHYVSIKSQAQTKKYITLSNLHSTMYLLNRPLLQEYLSLHKDLHSTMYLLNH